MGSRGVGRSAICHGSESPAGVAGLGSTEVDSSYRGGGREKGVLEAGPWMPPRDCTGPDGKKLAITTPGAKKTGPPLREARSGLGRLLRAIVESPRRSTRASGQASEGRPLDDSGADGGRSSRGLGRNGRSSLGRHALGDHAGTAAVAVRATTGNHATLDGVASRVATAARATARDGTTLDHLTATAARAVARSGSRVATARAAARSRGGIATAAATAVSGRSGRSSAVATTGSLLGVELGEKANTLLAVAAGSSGRSGSRSRSSFAARITSRSGFGSRSAVAALLGVELGEQTTARLAAMTTVAGNRTRLTADEADGNQRDEHRNRGTEETLHICSPGRKNRTLRDPNQPSRTASDPGRPPDRSKDVAGPDGVSQPERRAPRRNTPTTSGTAL